MKANPFQTPWVAELGRTESVSVWDRNAVLVGMLRSRQSAELLALAPEMLRLLCQLVYAVMRTDADYCRRAGAERPTELELAETIAEARLLIRHADSRNVPCEVTP